MKAFGSPCCRLGGVSGDTGFEPLADGLSEDVASGLSRFPYLQVIAHNSAMAYKGRATDIRMVGRELGARFVIEGSIRKRGRAIRVTAQLMDALSGTQLWAETYDREIGDADTFQIQDDLTDHIVTTVADGYGVLVRSMGATVTNKPIQELGTGELVLRYLVYIQHYLPVEHARLREALERVLKADAGSASAWAALSNLYLHEYVHLINPLENSLERAREAAWHAVRTDSASQMGWQDLAAVYFHSRDLEAFYPAAEHAMAINPLSGTACGYLGMLIAFAGHLQRGEQIIRRIMGLNPHHPGWYYFVPRYCHYRKNEYEEALKAAKQVNTPELPWNYLTQALTLGQLNRVEEARIALDAMRKLYPYPLIASAVRQDLGKWFPENEALDHLMAGFSKASQMTSGQN
jgi:TolB-like protein